ncbi:MAG: hypothetical protein U9R74_08365 [Pseudomonadota bacterium]|nr:hypothetical protein [Pseudomonadota bacterium]
MKRYIKFANSRDIALNSLHAIGDWFQRRLDAPGGEMLQPCTTIAAELKISEYEVFRRAYLWYHGRIADNVESEFGRYLSSGCETLPYYVNQFVRYWLPGKLMA